MMVRSAQNQFQIQLYQRRFFSCLKSLHILNFILPINCSIMLRQRPIQHKRKNSQIDLFYPSSNKSDQSQPQQKSKQKKSSNDKKLKLSLQQNKQPSNGKNILKLVQNSQRRVNKKQTVIEDINQQNKWGNQNIDSSNGVYISNQCDNDQNTETYFQFGRRSRCSSVKKQNYDTNYGYLNMEQITQVPDTMSNERRYDSHNFYQFPSSSNQNSLINFSNRLIQQREAQIEGDTKESQKMGQTRGAKLIEQPKHLKKRKQKLPRNVVIQGEQIYQQKIDLSELSKLAKKSKMFFVNRAQGKKSKSKENLYKVEKDKSRSSLLFLTKKSKNLSQTNLGNKKKSLSLKDNTKTQLKLLQKKPKSFQKPKDPSQTKSSQHLSTKSSKTQKQIQSQPTKSLPLGQKILMIQQSQSKLQNQYKILWQCMGELWQNSRITRYISQKNKSDIIKLKQGEKNQDEKMIKLKSEILSSISSARY